MSPEPLRQIDTTQLGPVRIDTSEIARKRERAAALLKRHSPNDVIARSDEERRRWTLDAMLAFAAEEVRRDRESRTA